MITAPTLVAARETLITFAEQRKALEEQVADQSLKITELEREVQRLSSTLSQTEQDLVDSRQKVQALRAQLPDAATIAAFEALTRHMTCASEGQQSFKIAA